MKIVVLDGHTLNPGDLSWSGLEELGECTIHERSAQNEVIPRATGAHIVLTNKTVITQQHVASLPLLQYIGVTATGYNNVDVGAARQRGIVVCNVPAYGTKSVAQMTMALLLELTLHAGHHARTVREGRWTASPDFCYWDHPLIELDGLSLGIIGYGQIGQQVAKLGEAFGMRLLVHTAHPSASTDVEFVSLEDLLRRSDIVTLHCPLTSATKQLINRSRIELMKSSAFLLNTSRGALIDEQALAEALDAGRIAGAAVDVLSVEPPSPENPLLKAKNCLVTPHIAWATRAARARLLQYAIDNVRAYIDGEPKNVVN